MYDTLWKWAAEQQRIYRRRLRGAGPPSTDDPVLRTHRFTNTYRAADRVSQAAIRVGNEPAPNEATGFLRVMLLKPGGVVRRKGPPGERRTAPDRGRGAGRRLAGPHPNTVGRLEGGA